MKKILLFFAIFATMACYAQNTVYVVFTAMPNGCMEAGIRHVKDVHYNPDFYRSPCQSFTVQNRSLGYFYRFWYADFNHESNNPIIEKPLSYLNEIDYIDWDEISPCLNKDGAKANVDYILSHEKIYFIDRADIKDGKIFLIPVRELKSAY